MRRLTLALLALALVGLLMAGCDTSTAPAEGPAAPATPTLEAPQGAARTLTPDASLVDGTATPAASDALADELEQALDELEQSLQNTDTLDDAGLGD